MSDDFLNRVRSHATKPISAAYTQDQNLKPSLPSRPAPPASPPLITDSGVQSNSPLSPELEAVDTRIWLENPPARNSQLPTWLNWPVVICALPCILYIIWLLSKAPIAITGFIPLAIVGPFLYWAGGLKKANIQYWVQATLWGGLVATTMAFAFQAILGWVFGQPDFDPLTLSDEVIGAVLGAPFIEEIGKGLAVVFIAIKSKKIDNRFDGMIFAGFAALGFTIVEDIVYITYAVEQDALGIGLGTEELSATWATIIGRTLITPFAHMIMSAPIGFAIGLAIEKREPLWAASWGWFVAMVIHAAWNGSIVFSSHWDAKTPQEEINTGSLLLTVGAGFAMFVIFAATLIFFFQRRVRDEAAFNKQLEGLTDYYSVSTEPVNIFMSWDAMQASRKQQSPELRKRFDKLATALVRLGQLNNHYVKNGRYLHTSKETEQELVATLNASLLRNEVPIPQTTPMTQPPTKAAPTTFANPYLGNDVMNGPV